MKPIAAHLPLALVLLLSSCAREGTPRMVDAGGYRVRMLVEGHGSPAVVFVGAGFGAWLETESDLAHDSPMLWVDLHKELLARIPGSKHVITNRSGHNIQDDEPELVVEAIREVMGTGR